MVWFRKTTAVVVTASFPQIYDHRTRTLSEDIRPSRGHRAQKTNQRQEEDFRSVNRWLYSEVHVSL